ncbi:MAG: ABC transporter permease [Thermoleophilia bacterium]|nr:ABC transporter permease [Thermoleophilia bacterium]
MSVIFRLTMRQMLGRGRTITMVVLALLPVALAVVYRLGSEDTEPGRWAVEGFEGLIVTTLLPLAAVVYGTAVLGAEIEDGTAVYLLSKPVSRARIVLAKLAASWVLTSATVLLAAVGAGTVALYGEAHDRIVLGFGVALVAGALVYSALFLLLSLVTSRALIAGLVYVFVWEGVVNSLFAGTRLLSVRHYTLGIADAIVDVPSGVFDAKLGFVSAIALMAAVGLGATWYAVRRLQRFEIGETT